MRCTSSLASDRFAVNPSASDRTGGSISGIIVANSVRFMGRSLCQIPWDNAVPGLERAVRAGTGSIASKDTQRSE